MDIQNLLGLTSQQPKSDSVLSSTDDAAESAAAQKNGFFDMLFGRSENGGDILSGFLHTGGAAVNQNSEVQVFDLSKVDFNKLKTQNPEIAALIENFSIDLAAALEATVSLNQQALGQLATNTNDVPETINIQLSDAIIRRNESDGLSLADIFLLQLTGAPIPADVHTPLLNDTNPVQTADGTGSPERNLLNFINMNLTPEQITRLQTETVEDDPALAALASLVQLVTPQQQTSPASGAAIPNVAQAGASPLTGPNGETTADGEGESQFLDALKRNAQDNTGGRIAARQGATGDAANPEARPPANMKLTAQGLPTLPAIDPLLTGDGAGIFAQDIDAQFSATQNLTTLSSLSSSVTQSASATTAHPATQMVAATLQKSASNGQNTNITIQLDPPELGRIEVRMDFDKDNTMKATLLVEKPETHLMLQRDAHALERALDQAGIETADSALNFELAQDGHDFGQNGGHDNHAGQGGGADGDSGDMALIETTVTWQINPETGHTHYNILA